VTPALQAELHLLLRLVLASALAAVLGWERQQAGKAAGLRTHTLVGLAAALYTGLGTLAGAELHSADPGFRADPIRILQAVALGVGFLGGGVITAGPREQGHVSGLTTAASIWSTAAIGIAVGLGHYALAAGATLLQLLVLHGLARFERPAP
jgi:putative Mg2+ transporter-C (MgtC) family protein